MFGFGRGLDGLGSRGVEGGQLGARLPLFPSRVVHGSYGLDMRHLRSCRGRRRTKASISAEVRLGGSQRWVSGCMGYLEVKSPFRCLSSREQCSLMRFLSMPWCNSNRSGGGVTGESREMLTLCRSVGARSAGSRRAVVVGYMEK